jgi:hypothetical protein
VILRRIYIGLPRKYMETRCVKDAFIDGVALALIVCSNIGCFVHRDTVASLS